MRTEPVLPARFRRKQFWIATLLLPAILYRALIPAGFMPAVDSDGALGLHYCPGTDLTAADPRPALANHHDGASRNSGTAGHGQSLCPFAATAGLAPLPTPTALVVA